MNRISLSKFEKSVYREIAAHPIRSATEKSTEYIEALYSLKRYDFAIVTTLKGKTVMEAYLTEEGRSYINANPKLRGPVNIDRLLILATLLVAIIALFVGCVRLYAATLH